jgi:hypothetical protein
MGFVRCRFFNPPFDLIYGVLLSVSGERIANEEMYGATLAEVCDPPQRNGRIMVAYWSHTGHTQRSCNGQRNGRVTAM